MIARRPPPPPAPPASGQVIASGGADALFIGVVFAASVVVGLVWAGAALASLAFTPAGAGDGGAGGFGVSLAEAVHALVRLPSNLSDPAAAWPPGVSGRLPGPAPYWACQGGVVALAAVVAGLGWRLIRPGPERDGLDVERSARFARRRDIGRLVVPRPVPGRIVLGRVGGRLVATEPRMSVCVVGPSQSHKTSGLCVPALLDLGKAQGAAIVASVKGDIHHATGAHRRAVGDVMVFDPTRVVTTRSATWSPLRAAATASGAQAAARALVDVAGDNPGLENGGFWMKSAKELLWPMLYAAAASGGTMAEVVRWVVTQDRPRFDDQGNVAQENDLAMHIRLLEEWAASGQDPFVGQPDGEDAGSPGAARQVRVHRPRPVASEVTMAGHSLAGLWSYDERTRSSIYATARTIIEAWTDPVVLGSSASCDITPEWLLGGDNTLYIVAPARDQARLRPLFACMVADLVNEAFDIATRAGGELPRKLLVLLDEAANICPVKELPAWCSTCPSHGITLMTVWQDRSQQRQRYGRDGAETVWNNSGAKVILSGLADRATAEVVTLLGEEDHERMGSQLDVLASRRSVSSQTVSRRLVTEDSLRRQRLGQGLLVYRDLPPMRLSLRSTHNDRDLRRAQRGPRGQGLRRLAGGARAAALGRNGRHGA